MLPATNKLTSWLALWLITWGAALFLLGHTAPLATVVPRSVLVVFPAAAIGAFFLFHEERKMWLSKINWVHIAIMAAGAAALCAARTGSLTGGYLFVTEHVLFQQIMIALLIFTKPATLSQILERVFVFFGLGHILLLFFLPVPWALLFTAFSLPGGVLFALLIEKARYGIGLSVLLHFSFYAVLAQLVQHAG
jgi:hypothetical protein